MTEVIAIRVDGPDGEVFRLNEDGSSVVMGEELPSHPDMAKLAAYCLKGYSPTDSTQVYPITTYIGYKFQYPKKT